MPPAKIVTGTLAQIEDALGEAIARAKDGDALAPVTVLVDNSLLKQQLPRAFAKRGLPQLNVRYFRPDELARAIASQADAAPKARLTRDAGRFLVRDIADAAEGYFSGIAGREGFANALGSLFRELEMGGFTGTSLSDALGPPSADALSKPGQIARLYAAYLERRAAFSGRADAYAAAHGARLEGPLIIYGVWSPSEVQARLIEHIATYADVTLLLPHTNTPADDAHRAFQDRLVARGATVTELDSILHPPSSILPTAPATSPELVSAPDTVREVWEAARWCLARVREGVAFHEMAVVYRNQDPYRALVDEIFTEAQIETYLHDGRLLSAHPWGRRLLALLELAATHEKFERANVMEFLTETRLPRTTREQYEDRDRRIYVRPSEWEAYTCEAGIVEGAEQWRERLQRLAAEKREQARDERFDWLAGVADRVDVLARFVDDFHAALAAHPETATWDEHLAYARSLAERYAGDTKEILEALDDLKLVSAVRERPTFEEFCRAVRDDLDWRDTSNVLKEPVRAFGRRGVAVLDASSLRHLRFRAVYLLGVSERAWPPPPRPDPLLLEHERRAINAAAAGGAGALPLRTEPDDEALTFAVALQSATEHLAMSYARADAGRTGKHLPSYFFRSVAESLEGARMSLEDLEFSAHVRRVEAGRLASERIDASLSPAEYDRGLVRRATAGEEPAGLAALAQATPAFGAAIAARRARWSASLTQYDGVMRSDESVAAARARSPFAKGDAVSASRLEMYATCPYRYFLRYGLGIEPVEEPEAIERLDNLQRGTLIHEILQKFLARITRDDPPSADRRQEHMRILYEIAQECGEERVKRGVTGKPLIWAMDKRAIDEDLDRWYGYEVREIARSGLLPGGFEARFGNMPYGNEADDPQLSDDEPLALTADGREIKLLGRVDRIDWDAGLTRFRVIDYKTGGWPKVKKDTYDRGESLQLPIYLHAAARMLDLAPEQGESQYFFSTSKGEFKRHTLTGRDLAASRAAFDQILTTIADGVDNGFFAPNAEHNHCQWCDYKDVCDAKTLGIMKRKTGDPRGRAYRAFEAIS